MIPFTESPAYSDMDLICRTCLNESSSMKSIFVDEDGEICKMLESCSELNIRETDGFPTNICLDCFNKLNISYTFRQQCEISHQVLLKVIALNAHNKLDSEIEQRSPNTTHDVKMNKCNEHSEPSAVVEDETNCNSIGIDLAMDCVEEKFKICEPEASGVNLENQSSETVRNDKHRSLNNCCSNQISEFNHNNKELELIKTKSSVKCGDRNDLDGKTETCQICQKRFRTPKNLLIHLRIIHLPVTKCTMTCSLCNVTFAENTDYYKHMRSKHKERKLHKCDQCDAKFMSLQRLRRHHLSHFRIQHPCGLCDKRFFSQEGRRLHMRAHSSSVPNKKHLEMRNGIKRKTVKRELRCSTCNKVFHRIDNLKKHILRMHGARRFKCPHCDKRYAYSLDFKNHVRGHTIRRSSVTYNRIKCEVCSDISRHIVEHKRKMHERKSRVQCDICDDNFRLIAEHKRNVHGKKSHFNCEICGGSFLHLAKHKRYNLGKISHLHCNILDANINYTAEHKHYGSNEAGVDKFIAWFLAKRTHLNNL